MKIAFVGFGEAGRAFHDSLRATSKPLEFLAWDILLDDGRGREEMVAAMATRGVAEARADELKEAEWIFCAVTADQSLVAATELAGNLAPGQLVIDINSVSPGRKRASAQLIEAAGGAYLDMAVMAPVHPRGHATPVLVAGAPAEAVSPRLDALGFRLRSVGAEPGQATAIKMVRSVFVKGLEAITVETLLAAEASGCFDEILASLAESYPGLGWPEHAAYVFERTLSHGVRRAAEMRECAATIGELGLEGGLAHAIADIQDAMGRTRAAAPSKPLHECEVAAVRAARVTARDKEQA